MGAGSNATVEVFVDFLSPYSWLALRACRAYGDRQTEASIHFVPRAVVYGVILEAEGGLGPGETAGKRLQAIRDVARLAALREIPLRGPPTHPFRSLEALRVMTLFEEEPRALELAVRLADAAWQDGLDLTDASVLTRIVDAAGLSSVELAPRIGDPAVKARLRERTNAAIQCGVCGVPTFRFGEELFHGQDRLDHVLLAVAGALPSVEALAREIAARPASVRRKSPTHRD